MLKPKTYQLLGRCIEDGVRFGITRAYKYTDKPTKEQMYDEIEKAIMYEICEWFHIDDGLHDDETVV